MPNTPILLQNRASGPAKKICPSENLTGMPQILGTWNRSGLTVSPATLGIVTA
jgi:hypothetical protein